MPISSYAIIETVIDEIHKKKPKTVLDYGMGTGMYGALIRNYIDMENMINEDPSKGKYTSTLIVGCDGFLAPPPSIGKYFHDRAYDVVFRNSENIPLLTSDHTVPSYEYAKETNNIGKLVTPDQLNGKEVLYDLVLFLDVIEHMSKNQGVFLIEQFLNILAPGGVLLISTPGVFIEQGEVMGNPLEKHVSFWPANGFPTGFEILMDGQNPGPKGHAMTVVKYTKPATA